MLVYTKIVDNIKRIGLICSIWITCMFFYYLIIYFAIDEIDPTKINFTRHIVSGLVIGLLFGLINGFLEVLIFDKRIKRLKFGYAVILKTIFFVLAFISTVILFILIKSSLLTPIGLFEVAKANEITEFFGSSVFYKHGLYAILFSFAINFLLQIDTKMGKKVLFNLFFGKFHNPTMQERVIMFLDLTSSTTIAEKIGDYKYSAFLKDFFYDLDEAINNNKGSVYQYVGDEVVVIWDLKSAVENNHCIKSYYEALASITIDDYIKEYGIYPNFKAGIHFGPVVITEVGGMKSDIAYHGDAMNTASRLCSAAKEYNRNLLISAELLGFLTNIDETYFVESVGLLKLKGKKNDIATFSVKLKD